MSRFFLNLLSEELEKQLGKMEEFAKENAKLAKETLKDTSGSWSAGGDREYSLGQAKITDENLVRLKNFKAEIDKAKQEKTPINITPICYVTMKYQNIDEPVNFYFVREPVYLTGFRFVTVDSALGKLVAGKKAGDKVSVEKKNEYGEVNASFEVISIE